MIHDYFNDCYTLEALEQKHRKLVLQLHPDRNPDKADATREFQEMQQQYEERKAELNGDYSGSQRARQRREQAEREEREREERERKEREARRVDDVLNEARRNMGIPFSAFVVGNYVYTRKLAEPYRTPYEWDYLDGDMVVHIAYGRVESQAIAKIEAIFETTDKDIMEKPLSDVLDGIYGGWEILQSAGNGMKGKRVPKVVMIRSEHYCFFGNPMGDRVFADYYVSIDYADMFSDRFHTITVEEENKEREQKRIEAEQRAKLEAEQEPLIAAWSETLIAVSAALTVEEEETVAKSNLKMMLKDKFPGVTFHIVKMNGLYQVQWEDGPMKQEVLKIVNLFCYGQLNLKTSPWEEHYGHLSFYGTAIGAFTNRKMGTLTKATILQQLSEIVTAFATSGYDDAVEVQDNDWMMIHLLAGVDMAEGDECPCMLVDGKRTVRVANAVKFVFDHTSYIKTRKTKKRKAKAA